MPMLVFNQFIMQSKDMMMRKLILFLLVFLNSTLLMAAPYKQVVFFGDSITDNGNLYKLLLNFIPKSPPYYKGRFSNGPTWAEYVGQYYELHDGADYQIYAVAGATAVLHKPTTKFISPSTLEMQIYNYLLDDLFNNKEDNLYIIWIGANDYVFVDDDSDKLTTKVVDKISWAVNTLISHGAKNFMVINLPDLSRAPIAHEQNDGQLLQLRANFHNQKLITAMQEVNQANPSANVYVENMHDVFDQFFKDPGYFDKEYNVNIKNVTDACWQGGFTLQDQANNKAMIMTDLQRSLINSRITKDKGEVISNMIADSAPLSEAYRVGKLYESGVEPCSKPDEYLFWDHLHPTAVAHNLLAKLMLKDLEREFPG